MPNEYRADDVPREHDGRVRSQPEIEVSRSRFHAQQAIALLEHPLAFSGSIDDGLQAAAVHATLSVAAATRALALTEYEEGTCRED